MSLAVLISAAAAMVGPSPAGGSAPPSPAVPAGKAAGKEANSAPAAARRAVVALVSEEGRLTPGTTSHLGLHFKIDPHWHTYWLGAAVESSQLEVRLELPEGLTLEPIQWPAPRRLVSEGDLLDHVYEGEVTLILPVRIAKSVATGRAKITGAVKYMICESTCVFEETPVAIDLPVAAASQDATPSPHAALFKEARSRLPKPLGAAGDTSPRLSRKGAAIAIEVPGAAGLSFFPAADCVILEDPIATAHAAKSRLTLRVEPGSDGEAPFRGVLEVRYSDDRGTRWWAVENDDVRTSPN